MDPPRSSTRHTIAANESDAHRHVGQSNKSYLCRVLELAYARSDDRSGSEKSAEVVLRRQGTRGDALDVSEATVCPSQLAPLESLHLCELENPTVIRMHANSSRAPGMGGNCAARYNVIDVFCCGWPAKRSRDEGAWAVATRGYRWVMAGDQQIGRPTSPRVRFCFPSTMGQLQHPWNSHHPRVPIVCSAGRRRRGSDASTPTTAEPGQPGREWQQANVLPADSKRYSFPRNFGQYE